MIIISKRGIFDASGCKIHIEGVDYGVNFHKIVLTHMSNGHSEVVAEFETRASAEEAYSQIEVSIKRKERHIEISDHETMLKEEEQKPLR
ncbi:MAG: hypothetical protein OXN27_17025 [Candidatus Poribacteria bacterium]|nr:hypothetical protein [Candidatus Poribacteria bacterium]